MLCPPVMPDVHFVPYHHLAVATATHDPLGEKCYLEAFWGVAYPARVEVQEVIVSWCDVLGLHCTPLDVSCFQGFVEQDLVIYNLLDVVHLFPHQLYSTGVIA